MIIGTRGSELALKQTDIAIKSMGLMDCKINIISAKGDKTQEPLWKSGSGIFTKELDKALLDNDIDLAVHSLKDIPVEGFPDELEIAHIPVRDDPRDCLLGIVGKNLVIGTDSIRRQCELNSIYSEFNLAFKSLRGNIRTRINKLKNKEYDGIIIAKAALDRLNIKEDSVKIFSVKEIVPAAGQGAIAVVKRKKDKFGFLKKSPLFYSCMIEREFINGLGGCKKPVGAYCEPKNRKFGLTGLIYKDSKRVLVNLSGDKSIITGRIKKWKAKYI